MTKINHTICNKEVEIATLIADMNYIKEKVGEIHHTLMGNGRPGILEEINKFKGNISTLKWIVGALVTALSGTTLYIFLR
jgi:hypothetical protein